MNHTIPWVEKYRPVHFKDIVLDDINTRLLDNLIEQDMFPNILLYGPPGTGKTTTILNLISRYQIKHNDVNKGLVIHLNASDERGIDIIRNQIAQFVHSKALISNGLKIIILDEVDYITKTSQQALKYLIQEYNQNVRFCLICNYISRLDTQLQNEFIHLKFNSLPPDKIIDFLSYINQEEKLNITLDTLHSIQQLFQSDMRSMINYMQSNSYKTIHITTLNVWENVYQSIQTGQFNIKEFLRLEDTYKLNTQSILHTFLSYLMTHKVSLHTKDFIDFCEYNIRITSTNDSYLRNYFIEHITDYIKPRIIQRLENVNMPNN